MKILFYENPRRPCLGQFQGYMLGVTNSPQADPVCRTVSRIGPLVRRLAGDTDAMESGCWSQF